MNGKPPLLISGLCCFGLFLAQAENVKITPLGSRTGEFCWLDRALIFEDPYGGDDRTALLNLRGRNRYRGKEDRHDVCRRPRVQIALVGAIHNDGLAPTLFTDSLLGPLAENNVSVSAGPANGYILTFTNSLKVVIASHANEVATTNGNVNPSTRTERFRTLLQLEGIPVYAPRSGVTMEFNEDAQCLVGCI